MKILSIVNQKGGVGKTTLSFHIARLLKNEGVNIGVVDCDYQNSLKTLENVLKINVITYEDQKNFKCILSENKYDILIVDTPPYVFQDIDFLIEKSDLVIIPTSIGLNELAALYTNIGMLSKAKEALIVLNKVDKSSKILEEFMPKLKDLGIEISENIIYNYVAINRALITGEIPSARVIELEMLVKEILIKILR